MFQFLEHGEYLGAVSFYDSSVTVAMHCRDLEPDNV